MLARHLIGSRLLPSFHMTAADRVQIVELYRSGLATSKIAEQTGRSRPSVRKALRLAGIKAKRNGEAYVSRSDLARTRMIDLYQSGMNVTDISRHVSLSARQVAYVLHKAGIRESDRAKAVRLLTEVNVDEMADLYVRRGLALWQIGERFSVSRGTVRRKLLARGIHIRDRDECQRIYSLNEEAFDPSEPSDAQLFFAGLLMTDGCVSSPRPGNNTPQIIIQLQRRDLDVIQRFREFLGSDAPIRSIAPRKVEGLETFGTSGDAVRFSVCSARLAGDLAKFGVVPRKSATARALIGADQPAFWRGCISGDGSLYFAARRKGGPRNRFCISLTGSESLVSQFADFIAARLDVSRPTIHPVHRTKVARQVQVSGRTAFRLAKILYGYGGVSLNRKQVIADRVLADPGLWCPKEPTRYEYCGRLYSVKELSEFSGIPRNALGLRLCWHRWSVARAVETPLRVTRRK